MSRSTASPLTMGPTSSPYPLQSWTANGQNWVKTKPQDCQGPECATRQFPLVEVLLPLLKARSDAAWLGDLDQPAMKSCEETPRLGPLVLGLEPAANLRPLPKLQIGLCQACSSPILTLPCALVFLTQPLACPVPTDSPGGHRTVADPGSMPGPAPSPGWGPPGLPPAWCGHWPCCLAGSGGSWLACPHRAAQPLLLPDRHGLYTVTFQKAPSLGIQPMLKRNTRSILPCTHLTACALAPLVCHKSQK